MRIKNCIIIGAVGAAALSLNSCSDFLEIESLNDIVLDKFWNEESDVENVVAGCYSAMQSDAVISRMMVWGEFRSDNIVTGMNTTDDADLVNLLKENITPNNSYSTWGEFYDVINRCNTVLYYAPQVAANDPNYTESELQATRAEVSAIRDLCYFYLIRAFKDVPYTTEPFLDDTQDMALPVVPFYDVLNSLIADLEGVQQYAVRKYPSTNFYAQQGRITRNAIYAMLCEMYLWNKDYVNAVKYADKVIDDMTADRQVLIDAGGSMSGSYAMIDGFPLISESYSSGNYYGTAFSDIFVSGCSSESILELVFMDNDAYIANTSVGRYYGGSDSYPGYVKPSELVCQDLTLDAPQVFRDKYDLRSYENVLEAGASSFGIGKYVMRSSPLLTIENQTIKNSFSVADMYTKSQCRSNWILYRLSDVMLLKAEALVQQVTGTDDGGLTENDRILLQEALDIVNALEKRSCCSASFVPYELTDYSSKSEMEKLVFKERRCELMFEGKRWFDLVRRSMRDGATEYLVQAVGTKGIVGSKFANMDAMFWPYNVDEMKVNPNLTQNPAYTSSAN